MLATQSVRPPDRCRARPRAKHPAPPRMRRLTHLSIASLPRPHAVRGPPVLSIGPSQTNFPDPFADSCRARRCVRGFTARCSAAGRGPGACNFARPNNRFPPGATLLLSSCGRERRRPWMLSPSCRSATGRASICGSCMTVGVSVGPLIGPTTRGQGRVHAVDPSRAPR